MSAQSVEVFGGYTLGAIKPEETFNRTTMKGWDTSVTHYPFSRVGLTADFSGYYATVRPTVGTGESSAESLPAVSLRQYSFLAGPQFRLIRRKRFESSFRVLVGAARGYVTDPATLPSGVNSDSLDETTFASLIGSNFDINVSKRVALRFSPGLYLTQFGDSGTQHDFRFSVGPVFKFGRRD